MFIVFYERSLRAGTSVNLLAVFKAGPSSLPSGWQRKPRNRSAWFCQSQYASRLAQTQLVAVVAALLLGCRSRGQPTNSNYIISNEKKQAFRAELYEPFG